MDNTKWDVFLRHSVVQGVNSQLVTWHDCDVVTSTHALILSTGLFKVLYFQLPRSLLQYVMEIFAPRIGH